MPETIQPDRSRFQTLVERHGKKTLIALAVIVMVGFGLRMNMVVNPLADPGDDAFAYRALAESLYEEKSYGGENFNTPSDWSPGAPLIYAGAYYLTGGVRDGVGRGVEALMGTAAILLAYLLSLRLSRRRSAALLAAAFVAAYPPFIHSTGALMSEPAAIFTLPAAVLAFLWADSRGSPWAWLLPGLLFGLTALIRPEYLAVAFVFGLLLVVRAWRASGPDTSAKLKRTALVAVAFAAAIFVPIVPWTIHNYVVLDRFVPITTGGGKATFVGTYLPGDGEHQQVKAALYEKYTGIALDGNSDAVEKLDPEPLLTETADRYKEEIGEPDLSRDAALGRLGKENFEKYVKEDPVGYAGMTVRKIGRMWGTGIGEAMSSPLGALIQKGLVLAGLAGLVLLAWRRPWEAIAMGLPIVVVTAVGAATLAPPRRNEILMTLVLPLAAVALADAAAWIAGRFNPTGTETEDPA
ncbi:MAG TPA: phospholipid carrier-dependent glycosyltransferase [Solirubrobacterales bacterium]|nr:phospholipid carrier-dependent glycosyltransferase [Solirubrobacterales bacterium]